jgi:hypothetical protein
LGNIDEAMLAQDRGGLKLLRGVFCFVQMKGKLLLVL